MPEKANAKWEDNVLQPLGGLCQRKQESDTILSELISKQRVVALSELDDDGNVHLLPTDVMILFNSLVSLRLKAKLVDGQININIKALQKADTKPIASH